MALAVSDMVLIALLAWIELVPLERTLPDAVQAAGVISVRMMLC